MLSRLLTIGLLIACISCASRRIPINTVPLEASCPPTVLLQLGDTLPSEEIASDTSLMSSYSLSSLTVANAYGIIDELRELQAQKEASDPLKKLLKEQEIDEILDLASLELETLTDFIDCKSLQLNKMKARLAESNDKKRRTLTNSAIIAGAVSSILVAGVLLSDDKDLKSGDTKEWIGVAGGLVATFLAVKSAKVNRTVMIRHEDNVIEAVWNGEDRSEIFSSSTWQLLSEQNVLAESNISIREGIVKAWRESSTMLGNEDNLAQLPILIDVGGNYDEAMLQLRIDMLEEIETGIDRTRRSLLLLKMEINK